jgi:hypothetical protein
MIRDKHPLPWMVVGHGDDTDIVDANYETVLSMKWDGDTEGGVNTELHFIVECVNGLIKSPERTEQ